MKTIQISTLTILLFFAFVSCKKKEENPTPAPVLGQTPAVTDPADTYRGFMISSTFTTTIDSTTTSFQFVEGRFHQKPVKNYGGGNEIDLKYISVNGSPLTNKDMFIYTFVNKPYDLNLNTDTWVVNDTNGIMTFTYTNKTPFPSVKDTRVIPDTASKTIGCSFKIESAANFNYAYFNINTNGKVNISIPLSAGDNVITISPAQLQAISTSTLATMSLYMTNTTVRSFFGKNYQFSKQMNFSKPFKVLP